MAAPASPVTPLAEPQARAEAYEKVFENASPGIAITDWEGRFEQCNPAYCRLLGYTEQELRQLHFTALVHPDDQRANLAEINRLKAGEVASIEIRNRYTHRDGSTVAVNKHVSVLHDGLARPKRLLALVTVADVSERQRAEERQQRTHDMFYRLIERNPFGVYVVDADFKLRELSLGARKVFANIEPLIGRDFAEILRLIWPEPFASEVNALFRRTLESGEPYTAPSTVQQRNNVEEVESYDWRIEQVMLPEGRPGVVCYFYDLSERQRWETQLRESEERFRAMANGLPLLVWKHDEAGRLVFVNDTYCAYFGVTREEMRDARWRLLTHPDDGTAYAEHFMACVLERKPFHGEVRARRADGAWRWVESWAQPRFGADGAFHGHVGTSADITERREAERALREADERKDEFLATLAHELRNPLAPIRNAVQILTHPKVSPNDAAIALKMIDRQTQAMVRLVDDLMDVSRIAHGKLQLRREPVALGSVIEQALDAVRPSFEQARLRLDVTMPAEPLVVDADPVRLAQVFSNLLTNAGKYTPAGGHVWLTVLRDGDAARVSVRDDGIGISPDQLPRIFDMFMQEQPALSRSQGGLGIGLALARSLVEAHGGTIEARSEGPGRGAEFSVVVPLSRATPEPRDSSATRTRPAPPSSGQRVLVVEDSVDGATSLATLLGLRGLVVTVASEGVAALAAAATSPPDIVLLDLGLPKMNGFEVCRALRALPAGEHATIVAISGWGQESDRRHSAEAGFDAHLVKPVEVDELLAVLRGFAGRRRVR
jgi:PAS domain S-box-containing protein